MKILSLKVVNKLIKKKMRISVAESCTGGLLASAITSVSGSSKIFDLAFVTYSNKSKIKLLKVSKKLIEKYGAVSKEVCKAMAKNVSKLCKSSMSVSITGIAGPNGGTKKKPVGLVYIGVKKGSKISIYKYLFKDKRRSYIQKNTVNKCLKLILSAAK